MNIKKSTKIYLCSPSGIFTGGPMCMHQLGFFLKTTLNLDVYMFYVPVKKKYKDLRILFMKILDIKPKIY